MPTDFAADVWRRDSLAKRCVAAFTSSVAQPFDTAQPVSLWPLTRYGFRVGTDLGNLKKICQEELTWNALGQGPVLHRNTKPFKIAIPILCATSRREAWSADYKLSTRDGRHPIPNCLSIVERCF